MQAYGSYVVVDPGGVLYRKAGEFLKQKGYDVKRLDFTSPESSDHYNPLHYLLTGQDVDEFVWCLREEWKTREPILDPYYTRVEETLMRSLVDYMFHHLPLDSPERDLMKLCHMLSLPLDELDSFFDRLHTASQEDSSVKIYQDFRVAAGLMADAIKHSVYVRILTLCTDWDKILSDDTVQMEEIGERPMAVFLVTPKEEKLSDIQIIANAFLHQVIRLTQQTARVPGLPVRLLLQDFPHIYGVPDFPQQMIHSYGYRPSYMLFIRSAAAMKEKYPCKPGYSWDDIRSQCPYLLYMGCKDPDTQEEMAKIAESAETKAGKPALSQKTLGIVAGLKPGKAICFVPGQKPVVDRQYDVQKHPNAKYLPD